MSFHYEVVIDLPMGEIFRHKFLSTIGKTQCCQMFKLMSPGMPNLWEFKMGKDIFTLSFNEEPGEQKERLSIDSMTLDLKEIVLDTIQSSVSEYLLNFLQPLAKIPKAEMEEKIRDYFKSLAGTLKV
jgi:hypothetical protein